MTKDKSNVSESARSLHRYVERLERLIGEKKDLGEDIKEVFTEAKSAGYDNKIVRIVLKRRAMGKAEVEEQDALVETYESQIESVLE